jgi:putative membrane protein
MYRGLTPVSLALVASLAAGCASAESSSAGKAMNDLEIAHTAYTAGGLDIRYAHLALATSENQAVRDFANTMIRDHSAVNDEAVALITKLQVTPQDNDLSRALVAGAAEKRRELRGLEGKAFDCAYAQNELGYHQVVNQTVEQTFLPNTTVPELKALLSDALVTFKVHEGHAEHMVAALNCGS